MAKKILDEDTISRSVLFPKDFSETGVLDLRKSFQFSSNNNYCQSVNCHRLVGDDPNTLHSIGLGIQAIAYARGHINRLYKGYCESKVRPIRAIDIEQAANFEVYHKEENGNDAHCEIKLNWEKKNARNEAINQLITHFSPLVPYIQ